MADRPAATEMDAAAASVTAHRPVHTPVAISVPSGIASTASRAPEATAASMRPASYPSTVAAVTAGSGAGSPAARLPAGNSHPHDVDRGTGGPICGLASEDRDLRRERGNRRNDALDLAEYTGELDGIDQIDDIRVHKPSPSS